MLEIDIRTGDRTNILEYGENLAKERYFEGFKLNEVIKAVRLTADTIVNTLLAQDDLKVMEQIIHNEIRVTLQMVIDKIEDIYEQMSESSKKNLINNLPARSGGIR
jgi:hypothetical protein